MTAPEGGFYSATDADSEGVEGKFFVWSMDELYELLGDNAPVAIAYWGATPHGNFEGENILFVPQEDSLIAERLGISADELQTRLAKAWQRWLVRQQDRLTTLAARLEGLSPLSVLRRGYSVTMRQTDQKTVLSAEQLQPGDELLTQLSVGKVISQVKEIL